MLPQATQSHSPKQCLKLGVAANDGLNDLGLALPLLIESHTRADSTLAQLGSDVSHLFAADIGEELVDIVYYTKTHFLSIFSFR